MVAKKLPIAGTNSREGEHLFKAGNLYIKIWACLTFLDNEVYNLVYQ